MPPYISEYVSYNEVIRSNTALRLNIDNTPNNEQLERIKLLCNNIFDPLRTWVGGRVRINSLFRGEELNDAVGGSRSSQHMANNGAAVDIDDIYLNKTNAEMFHYIKDNLDFDQLIWEFGTSKNPNWVHVSYREGKNRKNILIAYKEGGKTKYKTYNG